MSQGITVDFSANIARFTSALDKATNDLSKFQSHAERVSGNIGKVFAGLGVGLSVAGFAAAIKGTIDLADSLNDLSKRTGASVETLSGLRLIAQQSGTSLESMATGMKKLGTIMTENEEPFKKLGINTKNQSVAMVQLADLFVGMTDPAKRSTLAVKLFGKAGDEMLPFLMEGSAHIGEMVDKMQKLAPITKEMADNADKFNDQLVILKAASSKAGVSLANDLLPAMNSIIERAIVAQKEYGNFVGLLALVGNTALKMAGVELDPQKRTENSINDIYKERLGLWKDLEIYKKRLNDPNANWEYARKDIAATEAALKKLEERLQAIKDKAPSISADASENAKPVIIPFKSGIKPGGDSLLNDLLGKDAAVQKAQLEKYLKLQEDAAKREADILGFKNKLLETYYGENLLSIQDYYANKKTAQDEALANTLADYDKEIIALKTNNKLQSTSDVEKIANTGKINELVAKKRKAITDTAEASVMASLQEKKAADDLQKSLDGLNVQYLTMNNQLGEAAGLSFDLSNAQLKERLAVEGNIEALKELEKLRARAVENASTRGEAGFSRSMRNYVNIAADSGKQIENLMTNAFKGMEDALVKFVQTGKLDFKSLTDSIISDIIRISIRQSITGPLASGLAAGGFGSLFGPSMGPGWNYSGLPNGGGMANMPGTTPIMSYAVGTEYVPYDMVAKIHKGERIIPADQNNGKQKAVTVVNNFTIATPTDRRTQEQIASMAGASIQHAMRRNA